MKRLVFRHIKACFETGQCEAWESNEVNISDTKPVKKAYGITRLGEDLFECYDIDKITGMGQSIYVASTLKEAKRYCQECLIDAKNKFYGKETK